MNLKLVRKKRFAFGVACLVAGLLLIFGSWGEGSGGVGQPDVDRLFHFVVFVPPVEESEFPFPNTATGCGRGGFVRVEVECLSGGCLLQLTDPKGVTIVKQAITPDDGVYGFNFTASERGVYDLMVQSSETGEPFKASVNVNAEWRQTVWTGYINLWGVALSILGFVITVVSLRKFNNGKGAGSAR